MAIVFDCEIKKAILGRNEEPVPDIEYCNGWRDFENMGLSVVCTYDTETRLSRVFMDDNLTDFDDYIRGKPTAGFNSRRFDIPLLRENGLVDASGHVEQHYDILEQIWLALGLDPDKFAPATHGGLGLDAVCQATLGLHKTGHGAAAPVWWQQGRRGKVVDYCLNDTWLTGQLLIHILTVGYVINPKTRQPLYLATRLNEPPTATQNVINEISPAAARARNLGGQLRETVQSLEQGIANNGPIVSADTATDPPTVQAFTATPGGLGIIR